MEKTRKKKARKKLAGREKGKRKGGRACNHLFYDPLPPTFGTFEIIRFRLSNCWNVNDLESFSNFSRDYLARRLALMRVRAIWSVKRGSVGNTRLLPCAKMLFVTVNIFSFWKMLWRGLHFDWPNYVIFAACFMLRGSDTYIDFLRLLFLVGRIDDLPSYARAFSLTSFET